MRPPPSRRARVLAGVALAALVAAGTWWQAAPSPSADHASAARSAISHAPTPGPADGSLPGSAAGTTGVSRESAAGGAGAGAATGAGGGASSASTPGLPAGSTGQSARVEETGSLTLLVAAAQIAPDLGRLSALVTADGGFVAASDTQSATAGAPAQGTATLSVPAGSFADLLAQVKGMGRVDGLTTKATDVTGQYVDLQARIAALQSSRQQYLTIMTKASSIGDVLAVQQQLDTLQSQIEELQGQQQVLDSETTYATLTVTLAQKVATPAPVSTSGLATAWHSATHGFVSGVEGLVRISGPLLFVLLVLAALGLAGRFLWRRSGTWRPMAGPGPAPSGGASK